MDEKLIGEALKLGKRVFLRSAFLQGLLLLDPVRLPDHMGFARATLKKWRGFCRSHGIAPARAALQFIRWAVPEAHLVVGCETPEQLEENLRNFSAPFPASEVFNQIATTPGFELNLALIDPSRWPTPVAT